ncbi:MAG: glucose-6-phosphate dehydrogenase assembly protein OpcA [Actinomycetales bacterium]|nr:glucose-6-phosphate dehydrogenase assembly protein OpcA [Actinomycetales bacterium]
MIIDLPQTTTSAVNKRLVRLRDEGGAVALGRVLTLVIEASDDELEDAIAAANDASREHPCRVLAISTSGRRRSTSLDAQIRVGGDAGASEVVVLQPQGELLEHLDTLVIPLLLPDAPIVVWWPGEAPERPADDAVGAMAQRRITDSTTCAKPLDTLQSLRGGYEAGDTDLAWTRITLWRGLLAAALDENPGGKITRAEVEGDGKHTSVDLLAAWLAEQLRVPTEIVRRRGVDGVTGVRIWIGETLIELARPDGKTVTIRQTDSPDRRLSLPLRQLNECLAEELRRLDPDEVYGRVLTKGLARVGL